MANWNEIPLDAVAIIGAAGRFPKAQSLESLWDAIKDGRNCTDTVSSEALKADGVPDAELGTDEYITAMGRLDDVFSFDAPLFGLTPHDAELMDPQQRKFLECSYEALEDAGYATNKDSRRIGVYASSSHSSYLPSRIQGAGTPRVTESLQMAIGNDRDYLATRVSHLLNLTGPSLTVQTACSSSLTVVHLACQSLLTGECDMALAGGVSITLPQTDGYRHREGLILSRSGICRPFDATADGTVNGNGVGIVLLKRLDEALRDGDPIRAVIRATAVNNDGSEKAGYTAPSLRGEVDVVTEALAISQIEPEKIGFLSAHGTATAIGDPIEIEAVTRAFNTTKTGFCTLGAVKANIGHLDAAAGIAGLLVAMLALEHKKLPPIANFKAPNPRLHLEETPFVIQKEVVPWNAEHRFAMANAFGFGGTNVSVILEEASQYLDLTEQTKEGPFILPLSARSPNALQKLLQNWRSYLESCESIKDACWTAACRRKHFTYRTIIIAQDREELLQKFDTILADNQLISSVSQIPTDITTPHRNLIQEYLSGIDIQWDKFIMGKTTHIPLTPLESKNYLHALALRREWLPSEPASTSQAAAARMAIAAQYTLEPELLPEREGLLEDLCCAAVVRAFSSLGFTDGVTSDEALNIMGIPTHFSQLIKRLLDSLQIKGFLKSDGVHYHQLQSISDEQFAVLKERTKSVWNVWGAMEKTLLSTVEKLPELLRGSCDLRETLMPQGDLSEARRVYSELPNSIYFNKLIREHVREWINSIPSGEAIRIFEIGGGTAATTERLLMLLPPDRSTYTFTDVSPVFLRQAESRFIEYPFFQTALFNMEETPASQGFETGIYDIVIASNVLHAATDLSRAVYNATTLLRPGGLLILYEITRPNFLGEITTGLLLPNITDRAIRGIQPMASNEVWQDVLAKAGFEHIQILPSEESPAASLPDRLISAVFKQQDMEYKVNLLGNCAYTTMWERKIFPKIKVFSGEILLIADDNSTLAFKKAAQEREINIHHISIESIENDIKNFKFKNINYIIIDARALQDNVNLHTQHEQECLCGGLLKILHTFADINLSATTLYWFSLTVGAAQKIIHPQQATFWGMNHVVEMGHPELHLKQIDISDKSEKTIGTLFDLILSESGEERNAVSGEEWWVPRLERCSISELPNRDRHPDKNGWQVIVGGFGGIGLALAESLTSKGFRRIALLGRHLPTLDQKKIISSFEKQGVQIRPIKCDVTDYAALEKTFIKLENESPIRGIYHCAVVKRVSNADEHDPWPAFWQILAPKVLGAWNLHNLSESRRMALDYMVFFSSSVSVIPPYSLPHYVAANTYLDALATWRHSKGLPALSISWGAWSGIGTVSDPAQAEHLRNGGLHGFSPSEGLALLDVALQKDIPHLALMRVEWVKLLRQYGHRIPLYFERFSEKLRIKTEKSLSPKIESISCVPSTQKTILHSLKNSSDDFTRQKLLEDWLKEHFARILNISSDKIERAISLFDIGIDSLMFIEMSGELEKSLRIKISPSSLLQDFTIEKITTKLLSELQLDDQKNNTLSELYIPEPTKKYEPFALTDVQKAYWVGRRQELALGNTACQGYVEFDCEELDIQRLEQSWNRLINRHDALRTIIEEEGVQRVLETVPTFKITVHKLDNLSIDDQQKHLQNTRERLSHKVHTPSLWPLFDIEVSILSKSIRRLHLLIDNIIMDGRSISILLEEWALLYHNPEQNLKTLNISFRDYVSAVERYRKTPAYHEAEKYWEKEIELLPPAPVLPLIKAPESIKKPKFIRYDYRMEPELWKKLKDKCNKHGVTVSSMLLAAYAEVLGIWSQSPKLTINAPVFTRLPIHPQINNVVGEFTSSVLIRCETRGTSSFLDRIKNIQQLVFNGLKHCQMSGIEVMRRKLRAGSSAESSRMPIVFTSTFGLAKMADTGFASSIAGFSSLGHEVFNISQTPQVWIDNHVHDREGTLSIYWDTVEELFPAGMLKKMFNIYTQSIEQLANDKNIWKNKNLITFIDESNNSINTSQMDSQLLYTDFLRHVKEQPDAIAIIDEKRSISYAELFRRAAAIAQYISNLLPAVSDETPLVAVALPKGWQQAVAVLGTLLAGAAYIPIDPRWPLLRRQTILATAARVVSVITDADAKTDDWHGIPLLSIEEEQLDISPEAFLKRDPDTLAYVIFTSGTTGTPKGVMMSHAGAMTTLTEINRRFKVSAQDRILALSSLSFDLSVYDLFGIWAAGGSVVFLKDDEIRRPDIWRHLIDTTGVTLWNSVPMFWQMLLESGETPLRQPRLALLSGDRIPVGLPKQSAERFPETKLISLGGATEAGVWSICHEIAPDDPQPGWQSIPYGLPLHGQSFHVLHEDLNFCPEEVSGELYIGGRALALGYLHDKEKTAEHFILHPITNERLYRTGDLGVRHAGGEIEFLGRTDSQVKVGGFRIELGEIEAILSSMSTVSVAVVVLTKNNKLSAFIIPTDIDHCPSIESITLFLQDRLPQYMIPSSIRIVKSMPLTGNGKIDRRKLAEYSFSEKENRQVFEGIASFSESILCNAWSEILERDVHVTENVFALGADSLTAVRVEALLRQRYGITLSLQTVFSHPVVREMAKSLDGAISTDIIPLRQAEASDTLFCLGDAFGDGDCFREFARYWPMGTVKAVSVMPKKEDTLSILIERISRHISLAQPEGTLQIAGYSAGGLLAWLVTDKLQQQGRIIDRLILVDSVPLPSGLHNSPSELCAIVESAFGYSSQDLIRNLSQLCALLEDISFPVLNVPCVLIESQEVAEGNDSIDFWQTRTQSPYKIFSPGRHSECLKRESILEWLGKLIEWYELHGDK